MPMLNKPSAGDTDWTQEINDNWTQIERYLGDGEAIQWSYQLDPFGSPENFAAIGATGPSREGTGSVVVEDGKVWCSFATGATINRDAGVFGGDGDVHALQALPSVKFFFRTGSSVADVRFWVGLFSADPMTSSTPAIHGVGLRFDTGVDSSTWKVWSNDGSGSGTSSDSGVAMSANTSYVVEVRVISTSEVEIYINGSLVASVTSDLPESSQKLRAYCQVRNLVASSKDIKIRKISGSL